MIDNQYADPYTRIAALQERVARLQQALTAMAYAQEYDANGNEYFVHGKRTREMAREALAGPDTPADSQEGKT